MVIAQRRRAALHRAYSQQLLAAHEEERAWVAREVHDDAIQRLALVRHEVESFVRAAPELAPAQHHHLEGMVGELDDLMEMLRDLAHRLHPAKMEHLGLGPALDQLAEEIGRSSAVRIVTAIPEEPVELANSQALALFRIAQEGLRNVVRHAHVAEATLTVRTSTDGVELLVADQGRGFDENGRRGAGIGLTVIEEHARLAGGTAIIRSAPGEGTAIRVRIPRDRGGI